MGGWRGKELLVGSSRGVKVRLWVRLSTDNKSVFVHSGAHPIDA